MCLPYYVASLYSKRLLPRRVAYSMFWRSIPLSDCYLRRHVDCNVNFGDACFSLKLPLRFRQNWVIIFEDFCNESDGLGLALFRKYAARSQTIFDIGMNAGLYLYHAASVRPLKAKIFGFEPNAEMADSVLGNLRRNNLNEIEIVKSCVYSHNGTAELFLTDTDHMSSLHSNFIASHGRPIVARNLVPCLTLDSFVEERNLRIDLLKVDVEGAEAEFALGAWNTLRRDRPVVLLEICDANLRAEFIFELFALGYRFFNIRSEGLVEITNPGLVASERVPGWENYLLTTDLPLPA